MNMSKTAVAVAPAWTRYWSAIREAIQGSEQDFTEGNLRRAIMLLAVPMVLEMVMESLFAIVDVFWVAHLGANAIATVGLSESILMLVYCGAMGLSMAVTAMVARRIGEKDTEGAGTAAAQALIVAIAAAIVTAAAGIVFAPKLLAIMGASPDVIATGQRYAAVMLGSSVCIVLLFVNNGVFRGAGDAAIAMRVLWLSNIINLLLDPCFIFGLGPFPKLGVTGAAVSTTIGRSIGVVFQMWLLFGGNGRVKVRTSQLRIHWDVMKRLVRVAGQRHVPVWDRPNQLDGAGAHCQHVRQRGGRRLHRRGSHHHLRHPAFLGTQWSGRHTGWTESRRRKTGSGRAVGLAHSALQYGVSGSGGRRVHRLSRTAHPAFHNDPEVIPFGVNCLRIFSYGNIAYAYGMVMVQSFNGAGDTFTPTTVNFFGYWLFQIPLAYWLSFHTTLGPKGVFAAVPVAETAIAIIGVTLFRRGRWKLKKI